MTTLNLILIIILLIFFIKGFINGFIKQIFSIAGFLIGIVAAYLFAGKVAPRLAELFDMSVSFMLPLSYFLIFLFVAVACNLLGKISHNLITLATLGGLNRIGGAVAGVFKCAVILSILLNLYSSFDKSGSWISMDMRSKTLLYYPLEQLGNSLLPYVDDFQLNDIQFYEKYKNQEIQKEEGKHQSQPISIDI